MTQSYYGTIRSYAEDYGRETDKHIAIIKEIMNDIKSDSLFEQHLIKSLSHLKYINSCITSGSSIRDICMNPSVKVRELLRAVTLWFVEYLEILNAIQANKIPMVMVNHRYFTSEKYNALSQRDKEEMINNGFISFIKRGVYLVSILSEVVLYITENSKYIIVKEGKKPVLSPNVLSSKSQHYVNNIAQLILGCSKTFKVSMLSLVDNIPYKNPDIVELGKIIADSCFSLRTRDVIITG